LTTSSPQTGPLTFSAHYSGDANYQPGDWSLTQKFEKSPTGTVLSVSPGNTTTFTYGQSLTLTAAVSATSPGGGTPGGTVTFRDGALPRGTGTLSNGSASLTVNSLAVGSHDLTAVFDGNADYWTSTSSTRTETITKAATATALTFTPNVLTWSYG